MGRTVIVPTNPTQRAIREALLNKLAAGQPEWTYSTMTWRQAPPQEPTMPEPLDILTVNQAAARLGVSPCRVRQWIAAGELPAQRLGPAWMIRPADLALIVRRPVGWPRGRSRGPAMAAALPALLAAGCSDSAIARELGCARATVALARARAR